MAKTSPSSRRALRHDIVRPGKASMFGRSQSCRERNQIPVAWMATARETETVEAHRQSHSWNGERAPGPQRKRTQGDLERRNLRRPSPQCRGEGSMGDRTLVGTRAHSGGAVRHRGVTRGQIAIGFCVEICVVASNSLSLCVLRCTLESLYVPSRAARRAICGVLTK